MSKILLILWILVCGFACAKRPNIARDKAIFSIDQPCAFTYRYSADTTGWITCDQLNLQYRYGLHAYQGPLTEEEKFALAFKGKYHSVFFEKLHIDEKLYKMFVDSVDIVQVIPISKSTTKSFIPCTSCNYSADLVFRNRTFSYPFYATHDPLAQKGKIETSKHAGIQRKVYLTHDGLGSGIYLKHTDKKMQYQNLSIEVQGVSDTALVRKVLHSVKFPLN